MPKIDAQRLLNDLKELSAIGSFKTGVHRPTLSETDLEARIWLKDKMTEAGLDARIDGIANVVGYGSGKKLVLVGSHIESQPYAGRLDGALGVLYGLELARVFHGEDIGVDVGAWADEEGYFGKMLGSRSFCRDLAPGELEAARHREDGTPLLEALANAGLAGVPREEIDLNRYLGYCEAHIEQGDWLDAHKLQIGVVTAIVGTWAFKIRAFGVQNHAGTTRMSIRKDAGLAVCRLAVSLNEELPRVASETSVWTTGLIEFYPGVYTIIPGEAMMYFQFRDANPATLQAMRDCVDSVIERMNRDGPCRIEYTLDELPPTPMAANIIASMKAAADAQAPHLNTLMPSAAGHDAQSFGKVVPSGMLFVPSIGGISHHYDENTNEYDIVVGCQVFADAVERLLRENT